MKVNLSKYTISKDVLTNELTSKTYHLDEVGIEFFEICQSYGELTKAAKYLSGRYDIDRKQALADLNEFLVSIDLTPAGNGSVMPFEHHAVLEPTSRCSGGCRHCYHSSHGVDWNIEFEKEMPSILQLNNVSSVSITGGEVFSRHYLPRLYDLLQDLRSININVTSISTSGLFFSDEILHNLSKLINKNTVIRISMDTVSSGELINTRPGYLRLQSHLAPLELVFDSGYPVVVTTVVHNKNANEVIKIGEFIRKFDSVQVWNIRSAIATRQKKTRNSIESNFHETVMSEILRQHASRRYKFEFRLFNVLSSQFLENPKLLPSYSITDHPCRDEQNLITVKSNGTITQCPILPELDESYASSPDKWTPLLANLSLKEMPCKQCRLISVCGGGCRLYALANGLLDDCDLVSKHAIEWLERDPHGLLKNNWLDFYGLLCKRIQN
jgi:radical SAM protein with 4Fe4S-binding SPASM domain